MKLILHAMQNQMNFHISANQLRLKANVTGRRSLPETVHFRDALRILLSAEAAQDHPATVKDELPAIISLWLHSPQSDPLVLGSEAGLRWRKTLSAYAHIYF